MRRWLVLFLMVLMPLQFTWGAAAAYCQHETDPGASHFGHHVHQHAGVAEAPQPAGDPHKAPAGKLALDYDCGQCHLSAAKPIAMTASAFGSPATEVLSPSSADAFSTRAPDHPDRPNWRIA